MKLVVCCKAVPGVVTEVEVADNGGGVKFKGEHLAINESDEYALEEALALKEGLGGDVTVITMGPIVTQDVLYLALAKGADHSVRIDTQSQDPQMTAIVLATALEKIGYDLVLTGAQARDTMAGCVGIAVAERLGLPYAFAVTRVEPAGDGLIRVLKEIGSGRHALVELSLPAVLCIQTGIRPLSYAPPARRIRARLQPVRSLSLADLGLEAEQLASRRYRVLKVFRPERMGQAEILQGKPQEIAQRLLTKVREVM